MKENTYGVIVMNTILENMMYAIDIQDMNFGFNLDDWDKDRVLDPVYDALVCAGIDNKTFDVQCGVTKVVVIPNDSNFVLKTPLNGCYREVEVDPDYEEDDDKYIFNDYREDFEPYMGAELPHISTPENWNYCALEVEVYEKAKEEGLADMFAETSYFGTHNGRKFYTAEKCTPYSDEVRTPSEYSVNYTRSMRAEKREWARMCTDITALFVDDYGEERTAALLAFLEENSIDDLHSGNVMISLATNKIVLSDYSGFDN